MRVQSVLRAYQRCTLEMSFRVHLVVFYNLALFATVIHAINNDQSCHKAGLSLDQQTWSPIDEP